MSPIARLRDHGQSFWLDSLSRDMLADGSLARRVREQGLRGVTSNPAIFAKAMASSPRYDAPVREALAAGLDTEAIYERLAVADVRDACDLLRPVFDATGGADGFVSLEVSPHLAFDAVNTVRRAHALWDAVGRPNAMIKVPGTRPGLHAVEQLLFDGVNVNVTLLFGLDAYRETHQVYLRALERRLREGQNVASAASVASFFLSRIDVAVDRALKQRIGPAVEEYIAGEARALLGKAAIANAQLAYHDFREILGSERWRRLAEEGARPQRLVWASTGVKDPGYPDTLYIEPLIGPHTVSTMPEETAAAFADHGRVAETLTPDRQAAAEVVERLNALDIDFDAITRSLVGEGVQKFIDPYDTLLERLDARCARLRQEGGGEGQGQGRRVGEDATPAPTAGAAPQAAPQHDDLAPLHAVAQRLRAQSIRTTSAAGSGHATSCLSCAELVAALLFREMRWDPGAPGHRDMDRFLLSKGHAAPVLWAALHEAGAIAADPMTLRQIDSQLEGHPTPESPWVPAATGSLGQGLPVANGLALADRMDGIGARIFCLMGDGECSEGSVWEAAAFAADRRLGRLVAIVDANGLEQSGPAPYGTETLGQRFRAFGWRTEEIDGHDLGQVTAALARTRDAPADGQPCVILARTVKGRGVSFLEGAAGWHGQALKPHDRDRALAEIAAPEERPLKVEPRRVPADGGSPALVAGAAGVGPGAGATGPTVGPIPVDYALGEQVATRAGFGAALKKLGAQVDNLVVLDGDVKNSTKTELFAQAFPERFVEAQIAEQNMLGVALGLSASGKRACVATFAAFLTRAHDFIRMAVHSRAASLLVCGSHAGVSIGADGPSQMGLEDIAMFRALNGTTVLYPSDAVSAERLTQEGLAHGGIVYLRTTRGKTPVIYDREERFPIGGSKTLVESLDDRLTLVAAGVTVHTAMEAHRRLQEQGIPTRVIDAYSVKPLDVPTLERAARETGAILVVEDHNRSGGLGEAVATQIGRLGRVFNLGIAGEPHSGTPEELMDRHRISGRAIEREALAIAA